MFAEVGSAVVGALVPDGPLHPVDAVWALSAGLLVAAAGARRSHRWMGLVPVGFVAVVAIRRGTELAESYLDRPDRVVVVGFTIAAIVIVTRRPVPVLTALLAAVAASLGVWAVVPDTEIPLMAGVFLLGAGLGAPRAVCSRFGGALLLLPLIAAVAGSAGRPARLGPAVALGTVGVGLVVLAAFLADVGLRRRHRAGTPTTVAPGSTSVVTTAPAPTTAP